MRPGVVARSVSRSTGRCCGSFVVAVNLQGGDRAVYPFGTLYNGTGTKRFFPQTATAVSRALNATQRAAGPRADPNGPRRRAVAGRTRVR